MKSAIMIKPQHVINGEITWLELQKIGVSSHLALLERHEQQASNKCVVKKKIGTLR